MDSKKKTVAYWTTTGVVALVIGASGIPDVIQHPSAIAVFERLGYPAYFALLIGVWKLLGAVALIVPRFPRLKEWAYAGIIFDLSGASISHAAVGDEAAMVITPIVLAALTTASWALRPPSRKLESVQAKPEPASSVARDRVMAAA